MSALKPKTVLKMAGTSLAFAGALRLVGIDDDEDWRDAWRASLEVTGFALLLYLAMGANAADILKDAQGVQGASK